MIKKITSVLLTIAILITLLPMAGLPALAASDATKIDVSDTNAGQTLPAGVSYSAPSKLFTVNTGATPATITVTGDGTASGNTVQVATGVSNLTLILNGATIVSPSGGKSPIELVGNASVTIQLADGTTNTLTGTAAVASGLRVPNTAAVTIDGTGTLNAAGSPSCSGIGGAPGVAGGTISIINGTINTTGGGAGIGGGINGGGGGTISISGGFVTATSSGGGAGIGGGNLGAGGAITISGGEVHANGGSGGAGIGSGSSGNGGTTTISGTATVVATGGAGGAGIGSGEYTVMYGGGGTGTISIGGGATVTATGGNGPGQGGGAGIGGGNGGGGGSISISGTATVTAKGGSVLYGGAGIGGGFSGASSVINIDDTPAIMAAAYYSGNSKPAIDASSGRGSVINARLSTTVGSASYLKCDGYVQALPFPSNYVNFAFSTAAAAVVRIYSDSSCTPATLLGSIVTSTDDANIPVTDLSISPAVITAVKLYKPTVTVKKDASTWTVTPPTMKLSTSGTSLTDEKSGTLLNGVYTFSGLDVTATYYVWDTTNNQYTGQSVVGTAPNVTVNYYTVTLTSGTGIASTTGGGTYLSGVSVPIGATVSDGYYWDRWTQTSGGADVANLQNYTIPAIGAAVSYTANAAAPGSAPFILTTSLAGGVIGTPYSQSVNAIFTGAIPTWSITSGSLPAGLTLNTGVISGTPTAVGTSTFTIQILNPNGSHSRTFTMTVVPAYALTVNLNGGSGSTTNGSYASGASVSLDAGIKSGYTFNGWTSSSGGTFGNAANASTTFTMPGNATTITASWTQNAVTAAPVDPSSNGNTVVIVDGADYYIGTEKKDDTSTTATVDQQKLTDEIAKASDGSSTIVPVSANTSVTAQLVVKNVEDMAQKAMTLTVRTGGVAYNLVTTAIDTSEIRAALGTTHTEDIPFNVCISSSDTTTAGATISGGTVVISPVAFTITATYNGKTCTVDSFSCFVSRTIEITAEQAAQLTTGVVVRPDGTTYHVPTKVTVIDGKYYAVLNSLTNSTYTAVSHPVAFSDVPSCWAKEAINNMGSRMVVYGIGNNEYAPNRDITRAEFAAIIVRALGLAPGIGTNHFKDVAPDAWYSGYVTTASSYGIVAGYGPDIFGPLDKITREQAMTMIARAMKITALDPDLTNDQTTVLLAGYSDSAIASVYAVPGIGACVKTGVIVGRDANTLAPLDFITRAEVAVVVERLLQKSNLI